MHFRIGSRYVSDLISMGLSDGDVHAVVGGEGLTDEGMGRMPVRYKRRHHASRMDFDDDMSPGSTRRRC
jgi:hypothetical protein